MLDGVVVRPLSRLQMLFAAGALAWSSRAQAAAPDDLEWTAPRGCPSKAEIAARVGRLVGPTRLRRAPLRARSVVSKDEGGAFHGEVSLADDPSPARRIDGDSCDAVSDAIVLILAIAVDPDATTAADATRKPDEPRAEAVPAAPTAIAEDRPSRAGASSEHGRRFAVTGAGVADSGLFGVVTPGAELALGLRAPHVALDVAGTWLATTSGTIAARPSEGSKARPGRGARARAGVALHRPRARHARW